MAQRRIKKIPLFITFEGIDGSGKTTQLMLVYKYLSEAGYAVNKLREPGSTPIAERIRKILLDKKNNITDITELLLYEAARSEIVDKEIAPLLKKKEIVLCDRFYDSTTAYQGYGRRLDIKMVKALHRIAVNDLKPDLTFIFDIPLKAASRRRNHKADRLESQSSLFFRRVRRGYLEIAGSETGRVKVIDASKSVDEVFESVKKHLMRKLKNR